MTRGLQLTIVTVCSLFCLHLLRNVSIVFPLFAWVSALFAIFFYGNWRNFDRVGLVLCCLLAAAIVYTILISFIIIPNESYFMAAARFVFVVPFAMFVVLVVDTMQKLRLALCTFTIWVAVGVATVVYQTIYGPIDWFALPAERGGSLRYASLLGNLTAIGIVGGLALPLAFFLFRNMLIRSALVAVIVLGLLLSLQKAALANLSLFLLMLVGMWILSWVRHRRIVPDKQVVVGAIVVLGAMMVPLSVIEPKGGGPIATDTVLGVRTDTLSPESKEVKRYWPALRVLFDPLVNRLAPFAKLDSGDENSLPSHPDPKKEGRNDRSYSSVNQSRDLAGGADQTDLSGRVPIASNDVSLVQGALDRLAPLPAILFRQYGAVGFVTGVGLVGGSGTLGFLDVICEDSAVFKTCRMKYPMAHNGIIELLAMGGIPLVLSFILFYVFALIRLGRRFIFCSEDRIIKGILCSFVLFLPNALTGAGILSQPFIAGILYTIAIPVLLRGNLLSRA